MTQLSPKITVDVDRRTITVGDITYSVDLLAGGLETRPNQFAQISISDPLPDGARHMVVSCYQFDAAMQKVRAL